MAKKDKRATRVDIHLHPHTDPELKCRLDRIEEALINLVEGNEIMRLNFQTLIDEVAETKGVANSAILLLQKVADTVRANIENETELKRIVDDLDASNKDLAAAVAATPGENPEPPLA